MSAHRRDHRPPFCSGHALSWAISLLCEATKVLVTLRAPLQPFSGTLLYADPAFAAANRSHMEITFYCCRSSCICEPKKLSIREVSFTRISISKDALPTPSGLDRRTAPVSVSDTD
ncbi:hypothetical protein OH77DRAFT_1416091 [Trametes cingulata]|nr:hypothetical protein OH77DRAFT_1416091 [Trametes cingulata]